MINVLKSYDMFRMIIHKNHYKNSNQFVLQTPVISLSPATKLCRLNRPLGYWCITFRLLQSQILGILEIISAFYNFAFPFLSLVLIEKIHETLTQRLITFPSTMNFIKITPCTLNFGLSSRRLECKIKIRYPNHGRC